MSQEHSNNGPQNVHDDRALLDHTTLLVNAFSATRPGPRPPEATPQHPRGDWRDYLHSLGANIMGYRMRLEVERVARRMRNGELERSEIDAWAVRAARNSGFGSAEAANNGNYSSAA